MLFGANAIVPNVNVEGKIEEEFEQKLKIILENIIGGRCFQRFAS